MYSLNDVLPAQDLHCWSLFVQASILLRQHSISVADVTDADIKLLEFCRAFETCYGKEFCTSNMHLHAHLKECVLDFGPISAFWAFPFEHFNGILELKPEEQITKFFRS